MKLSTKLKLQEMIRRIIKEESDDDGAIISAVRKLKTMDSDKRDPGSDPDSPAAKRIMKMLQQKGVMDRSGKFIKSHPLYKVLNKIYQ